MGNGYFAECSSLSRESRTPHFLLAVGHHFWKQGKMRTRQKTGWMLFLSVLCGWMIYMHNLNVDFRTAWSLRINALSIPRCFFSEASIEYNFYTFFHYIMLYPILVIAIIIIDIFVLKLKKINNELEPYLNYLLLYL